jgi:hypothetical protein
VQLYSNACCPPACAAVSAANDEDYALQLHKQLNAVPLRARRGQQPAGQPSADRLKRDKDKGGKPRTKRTNSSSQDHPSSRKRRTSDPDDGHTSAHQRIKREPTGVQIHLTYAYHAAVHHSRRGLG